MTVEQGFKHDELMMVNEGRAIRCTLDAQFVEKMTRWKCCSSHDNTMLCKCQLGEFLRLTDKGWPAICQHFCNEPSSFHSKEKMWPTFCESRSAIPFFVAFISFSS
jgi:hypothetical protein